MFVLMFYDVGEKRVGRVLKTARRYLTWIQNSVLEGDLSSATFEALKTDVRKILDEARTVRVDSDNKKNRRTMLELMQAMRSRDIDILIGTQIIAKGLHFPHVALVGVLWADAGLSLPDFRAGERTFAQLVQVTGRAGRGETPGRVIIQTCRPDHYAVRLAQQQDYVGLYAEEIELRRQLAYPPR